MRLNRLLFEFRIIRIPFGFHRLRYFVICPFCQHPQLLFAMAIAVYLRPPASLTYLALRCSLSFFVRCISISRCAKCLIFCAVVRPRRDGKERDQRWEGLLTMIMRAQLKSRRIRVESSERIPRGIIIPPVYPPSAFRENSL
jgi:hypothetical protein